MTDSHQQDQPHKCPADDSVRSKDDGSIAVATRRGFMVTAVAAAAACSGCAAAPLPAHADVPGGDCIWRNVAIRGGGFVTGIIPHPARAGLVYARTDVGGAYRRISPDSPWIPMTDWIGRNDANLSGIESLALDPTNPDIVYLAAGMYTQWWAPKGAILRSADQGKTWLQAPLPIKLGGNEPGRFSGSRLMVDPNFPARLFFGSRSDGLWGSDNGARSWRRVDSFPVIGDRDAVGLVSVVFDAASGRPGAPTPVIYVAVSTHRQNLFVSPDAGRTWKAVPGQPVGLRPNQAVLAADGRLYISYGRQPGPNSMTDGAVWCFDTRVRRWEDITPLHPSPHDQFGYGTICVDTGHPDTIMTGTFCRWAHGDTLFRSANAGKSWLPINPRQHGTWTDGGAPWIKWHHNTVSAMNWIGSLQIDPHDSNTAMYTTGCGLFTTRNLTSVDNGGKCEWIFDCRGLEETVVNKLISPPRGPHLLSTVYDIDGFRHDDLRQSPRAGMFNPSFGSNTDIDIAEHEPEFAVRVFGGRNTHGAISHDAGRSWKMFPTGIPGNGGGKVAVCAAAKSIICVPDAEVPHVTTDAGRSWRRCAGLPGGSIVLADRTHAGTFYAFGKGQSRLWVSRNGGESFTAIGNIPIGANECMSVPGLPGHLWLAGDGGLFFSINGGESFHRVAGVDQAYNLGWGKAAPGANYPALFLVGVAAGRYGFYRSDNQGKRWRRINDFSHQFFYINTICGDPRVFGRVYVGTSGRGILFGDSA